MKMAGCTSGQRSNALLALGALCAAGAFPCVSFGGPIPEPVKVTAVRFWSLGDVTRVAIEVSSDFKYRSDRLDNPDRLFFDIRGARPVMAEKKMYTVPVGDPLLKQI